MEDAFSAEEKAYWAKEAQRRSLDVDAARSRGDPAHLIAGAELRLREAVERLAAMSTPSVPTAG